MEASINHVRFEGVGRSNENIMVDHVGEGGVKQDIMYIFLYNFLNFNSVEFILPATRTSFISVEQSAYRPLTEEEPCDLQESFKDTLQIKQIPKAKSLNRSEFQYFVI